MVQFLVRPAACDPVAADFSFVESILFLFRSVNGFTIAHAHKPGGNLVVFFLY